MQLIHSFLFSQNIETIYSCYINEAFVKSKLEHFGSRNVQVKIQNTKNRVIIEYSREVKAEPPGMLKKFASSWTRMDQKEIWEGKVGGPYTGNMSVEIDGIPITIYGHMTLTKTIDGTVANNTTNIKCNIPFFGKAITKFVAQQSEVAIAEEFEYLKINGKNFL